MSMALPSGINNASDSFKVMAKQLSFGMSPDDNKFMTSPYRSSQYKPTNKINRFINDKTIRYNSINFNSKIYTPAASSE